MMCLYLKHHPLHTHWRVNNLWSDFSVTPLPSGYVMKTFTISSNLGIGKVSNIYALRPFYNLKCLAMNMILFQIPCHGPIIL